jgi:hypothetical protein
MSPRLPGALCLAGVIFFIFPWLLFHTSFAGRIIFNTICQTSATCLVSASVFFSLHVFYTAPQPRRVFLAFCLLGCLQLLIQFFANYELYAAINRTLHSKLDATRNQIVAGAIEKSRSDPSPAARARAARVIFMLTGMEFPYRGDGFTWIYYVPTLSDQKAFEGNRKFDASVFELRQKSEGLLRAAINIVIYTFITFLFRLIWLAVKRPPETPAIQH